MSTLIDHHEPQSSFVARMLALAYGGIAYVIFLGSFLYAIGFVEGMLVPKTLHNGTAAPLLQAFAVNLLLLGIFAVQHSGMARRGFKRALTSVVSPAIERATFVLASSLALILLYVFWQPMPQIVWQISNPSAATAVTALSFLGWLIVLYATFLISHFELFGLTQVVSNFLGRALGPIEFKTPGLYRVVRHPIYLGFIIAFWAAPIMTLGHLLFAVMTTAYIFIGIWLEERDLVALFGDQYRRYRERVAMILPGVF